MSWVAVAVGGASLVSGYMNNKAQKKASATQSQGADRAAELQAKASENAARLQAQAAERAAQMQWNMFTQSRTDNEPFRQAGLTGTQEYMALLGLPTSSVQSAVQQSNTPMPSFQSMSSGSSGPVEWFDPNDANPHAEWGRYYSDPAYRQAWDEVWGFHNGNLGPGSDRAQLTEHLQRLYDQNRAAATQAQAPAQQQTQAPAQAAATPGTSLTQEEAFARFRNTPGYQFGLNEGVRALDSSAAASGGLFSGKAAKALTKFGTDYADQQGYTPYANRLAALAGIGQTATNQNNALSQGYASSIGNAWTNSANAQAGGLTGAANARASGIQNSANARANGIVNNANTWSNALGQGAGLFGYMYGNGWGGV